MLGQCIDKIKNYIVNKYYIILIKIKSSNRKYVQYFYKIKKDRYKNYFIYV